MENEVVALLSRGVASIIMMNEKASQSLKELMKKIMILT